MPTNSRLDLVRDRLEAHGQAHVVAHAGRLAPPDLEQLLDQIEHLDLAELDRLITTLVRGTAPTTRSSPLEPAPFFVAGGRADAASADSVELEWDRRRMRDAGESMLRDGRVAAFTVAGGQGTRLGWSGPKGTYPATVVTGKPLFRLFAEQIVAIRRRYGVEMPWYIMTSPANHAATESFFRDNNHFGLPAQDILLFPQGTMPAVDRDGKLLLESPSSLALSPDGHGGALRALRLSGAVDDMDNRGVSVISYFQVDNPLVRIADSEFLGLHADAAHSSAEMSSKMVRKAYAGEKVGVFCRRDGRTAVVEYSDLPAELAEATDDSGNLRFLAGSIAIHAIGVDFLRRLTDDPATFGLPFHRADKKVPYYDSKHDRRIDPETPNGIKFETFVFDAIPLAERSIVVETLRSEEFAPIKNADGNDSPATSHQLQSDRAGEWLAAHGVEIPRRGDGSVDAKLEISPLTALEASDLSNMKLGTDLPKSIEPGAAIVV